MPSADRLQRWANWAQVIGLAVVVGSAVFSAWAYYNPRGPAPVAVLPGPVAAGSSTSGPFPWWPRMTGLTVVGIAGFVIAGGLQLAAAWMRKKARASLRIHSAAYGTGGPSNDMDVTDVLQRQTKESLVIAVENDVMGRDPVYGQLKRLQVEYSYGNRSITKITRAEHERLVLPETLEEEIRVQTHLLVKAIAPDWLVAIPNTDIRSLDTFLYWTQNPMMYLRPHLEGHSHYVDLWFGIINASVFSLTLVRIEGSIRYLGDPFPRQPEPISDDSPIILPHAAYTQFGLRQWLEKPASDHMIVAGSFQLDTNEFAIWFRYTDHRGEQRVLRKTFTGDVFKFEKQIQQSEHEDELGVVIRERDALRAEHQQLKNERDGMEQAWLTCKKSFGIQRLIWFAKKVEANVEAHNAGAKEEAKIGPMQVTIRFVGYTSTDFGLAKKIESILKEHTQWKITLDGGNNPALRPSDEFKVIFELPAMRSFLEVAAAFSEGRLIDAAVGVRENPNRFDSGLLIIEVLPTAS